MNDTISRTLAEALLNHTGVNVDIVVGRAMPRFPSELLSAQDEVLGGIEDEYRSVTVLAIEARSAEVARKEFVQRLIQHGFAGPPESRGFANQMPSMFHQYARGEIGVSIITSAAASATRVAISVAVAPRFDMHERHSPRMRELTERQVPYPKIEPPPGVQFVGGGGGGSGAVNNMHTEMRPAVDPAFALQHFLPQIVEQGWIDVGGFNEGRYAVANFQYIENSDSHWSGMLCVQQPNDALHTSAIFVVVDLSSSSRSHSGGSHSTAAMRAVPLPPQA